jgi:hypothetical protein
MIKNIDELLSNISTGAMYYAGLDSDANLVTIGAGGDIPYVASWDKDGYRPYIMCSSEDYHPISRETFIEMVKSRQPLI